MVELQLDAGYFVEAGRSFGFGRGVNLGSLSVDGLKTDGAFKSYLKEPTKAGGKFTYGDLLGSLINAKVVTQVEIDIIASLSDEEAKKYIITLLKLVNSGMDPAKAKALALAVAKSSLTLENINGSFDKNTLKTDSILGKISAYYDAATTATTAPEGDGIDAKIYTLLKGGGSNLTGASEYDPAKARTELTKPTITINWAKFDKKTKELVPSSTPTTDQIIEALCVAAGVDLGTVKTDPPLPVLSLPEATREYDALTKFFLGLRDDSEQVKTTLQTALVSGGTLDPAEKITLKTKLTTLGLTELQADDLLDKLADGELTREEAKALDLSDEFFTLIDNAMDAAKRSGNDKLTLNELLEAVAVIQAYADTLASKGMTFQAAVQAYKTSSSFRNVDFHELRRGREEVIGYLQGVSLTDSAALRKALESKGLHKSIIDAVIKYVNANPGAKAEDAAGYLLRLAMASLTGMWGADKPFGVDEIENIGAYNPKKVTKGNLLHWLESGEVEEEGENEGSSSEDTAWKKLRKAKNAEEAARIYRTHKKALGGSTDAQSTVLQRFLNEEKYAEAIRWAQDNVESGVQETVFGQVVEKHLERVKGLMTSDPAEAEKELEKLIELVKLMGDKGKSFQDKINMFTYHIALSYAEKGGKDKAYALIAQLPLEARIQTQEGGSLSFLEAEFTVARKLSDTSPMDKVLANSSTYSAEKVALAKAYQALVMSEKAATEKEYEDAFKLFEEVWKSLKDMKDGPDKQTVKQLVQEGMRKVKEQLLDMNRSTPTAAYKRIEKAYQKLFGSGTDGKAKKSEDIPR